MNISEYMMNEASVKTDYTFYIGFVKRKKQSSNHTQLGLCSEKVSCN